MIYSWPAGASAIGRLYGGGQPVVVRLIRGREVNGTIAEIDGFQGQPTSIALEDGTIIPWMQIESIEGATP